MKKKSKITLTKLCLVGIKGLPANYGGFETFAENLVLKTKDKIQWTVYGEQMEKKFSQDNNFKSVTIPIKANGYQSMLHDALAIFHSVIFEKPEKILILGYSGSWVLPFLRLFSKQKILTNIDGLEWRRDKYNYFTKKLLYFLEQLAIIFSHKVIIDNSALIKHINPRFRHKVVTLEYGGDNPFINRYKDLVTPKYYYSISRIVPENKVEIILEAFTQSDAELFYMGNWTNSEYGRKLQSKYSNISNIHLLDPEYDIELVTKFRLEGKVYVHGHSVGGTNPSLVEAIQCNNSFICFDCDYNKATLENNGNYFFNKEDLIKIITTEPIILKEKTLSKLRAKYSWDRIVYEYLTTIKNT